MKKLIGTVLQENSTHQAVKNGNQIEIWIKGAEIDDLKFEPEYLYSIPLENKDDLLSIFDRLDEDNRINVAEFRAVLADMRKATKEDRMDDCIGGF